jgi:hypothetical protein
MMMNSKPSRGNYRNRKRRLEMISMRKVVNQGRRRSRFGHTEIARGEAGCRRTWAGASRTCQALGKPVT